MSRQWVSSDLPSHDIPVKRDVILIRFQKLQNGDCKTKFNLIFYLEKIALGTSSDKENKSFLSPKTDKTFTELNYMNNMTGVL